MRMVQRPSTPPASLAGSLATVRQQSFLEYLCLNLAKRETIRVPITESDSHLTWLLNRLSLMDNQILTKTRTMPDKPYSSLVKAWSSTLKT